MLVGMTTGAEPERLQVRILEERAVDEMVGKIIAASAAPGRAPDRAVDGTRP